GDSDFENRSNDGGRNVHVSLYQTIMTSLEEIAAGAVKLATSRGASDAECTVAEGDEFSAGVRMGEIEKMTQAGSRGAGIRVLIGKRAGSSYTSDLSKEGIERMVRTALDLAQITSDDPFAGMPEQEQLGSSGDMKLFDEAIGKLEPDWKIEQAIA